MEQKNIVATIYLKNGQAVKSIDDPTPMPDVIELARLYNDSGIDKIIVFDLSDDDEEHEKNIHTIKNTNGTSLYAGRLQVIVNGAKAGSMELAEEASKRFGKERILVSVENVDFVFKHQKEMSNYFHELLVLNTKVLEAIENLTDVPYVVYFDECDYEKIIEVLKRQNTRGIAGSFINDPDTDVMEIKSQLSTAGIKMDNFEPALKWEDLKTNSDGLVPVIVQDYRTEEVLMLAYMNEEAFRTTINVGKMTYYSRSRHELWTKGMTSGHIQFVRSRLAATAILIRFWQRFPRSALRATPEIRPVSSTTL